MPSKSLDNSSAFSRFAKTASLQKPLTAFVSFTYALFALSCHSRSPNAFVFNAFRTLCKNMGGVPVDPISKHARVSQWIG